ncbi:peptide deformylase [Ligilactobacillus animalis]|uniref:peptide deformylase n=1 Tax=Ligilactobacillus animalis TaxID=1605 RepID=UPI000219495F|nr:peptide deformylase [Ligilactobacillus animalis]KRM59465.1 peptide deformylase [Ligilactobacillus animalis KCTC 3501 = DSM 20602]WKB74105.1 peptide deformylase [Ligilactobacillus animalis]
MIREINHDPKFLSQKAVPATPKDDQVVADLFDTLQANQARCVGMAANMIGENKQIIVCQMGPPAFPMLNPKIIKKARPYQTTEGCLSLTTTTETTRYDLITVQYFDRTFTKQKQEFQGFIAQIIQHEIDHLNGILI